MHFIKNGILLFALVITFNSCSQVNNKTIDTLEFQVGYPNKHTTALEQLKSFPSPRYKTNNNFLRLFSWMNPMYMASNGEEVINLRTTVKTAVDIEEELIINWNYNLLITHANSAANIKSIENSESQIKPFIDLANKYPQIPLGITTFWGQLNPKAFGLKDDKPNVYKQKFDDKFYIKDASGKVVKKVLNFATPDSLFSNDGKLMKICIQNLTKYLTRPINIINENGEEPPGAHYDKLLKEDADMIAEKNKLGIDDWHIYTSVKKKHFRNLYSSQFMDSLPELKNTKFTVYTVEGGPIDRFDWNSTKATCSKIKGNYYSTPDFYPRTPDNWKLWKGAWHGWKWINDGRKVEIKSGDRFFSPYIAAGWDFIPEKDMRPAQWLGLLKCLSVVGAEYYYVCYFNLQKPYSLPQNYVWQAAIPAYAQAIATNYSDVFFNGNVLIDENKNAIVTYPSSDKNVLVTVRKKDSEKKFVIAATLQPSSNTEIFPLEEKIEINLDGETLLINARRQGSVFIYDKTAKAALFYQLDRWHQYEHPERWRKEWITEAEVFDTANASSNQIIKSEFNNTGATIDFTNAISFIHLKKNQWVEYAVSNRDLKALGTKLNLHILVKGTNEINLTIKVNEKKYFVKQKSVNNWDWINVPFDLVSNLNNVNNLRITSTESEVNIDKLIISATAQVPNLKGY